MPKPDPRVAFAPLVSQAMQRGIHTVVAAVRPTLGPRPRIVAAELHTGSTSFEFLDEAGVIARRIIELPDRNEDVGAMLARKAMWQVHDKLGDGAASTGVMFETVFDQGVRYLATGGNALQLRRYLEAGLAQVLAQIDAMTVPLRGEKRLAEFALSMCQDTELAGLLAEIIGIIGEWGRLDIREGQGRELEREYVEGIYWTGPAFAREMLPHPQGRTELENAAVLITDLKIEDPADVVAMLRVARDAGIDALLLIAQSMSQAAISVLLANDRPGQFRVVAAKMPFMVPVAQHGILGDMALLTGGRPMIGDSGARLATVTAEDFGYARRVWVDNRNFGLIGGRGNPKALRRHIRTLRSGFRNAKDAEQRKEMAERIGKLLGGSATLYIGGTTEPDIKRRQATATRTAEALRGVLREGVVPGGGSALLACRAALKDRLKHSDDLDERTAYQILIRALEEPTRTIIANAGADPFEIMAEINRAGPGYGYDVQAERVVCMADAGIWSSASVTKALVISAITTAAMALTIEVVVHRDQKWEVEP